MPSFALEQERVRVATWNVELTRKGPGLLLRDIAKGEDAQVQAVLSHILQINPDVLLLTGFDTDMDGQTLHAFAEGLKRNSLNFPYRFTRLGNAGLPSGRDLDQDGRSGEPQDAQSYGEFRGVKGMAVLSRLPILTEQIVDFTPLLWRDVPQARIPDGFWTEVDLDVLRLSSNSHWDIPLVWNTQPLHLFAFYAGAPVFDGEEDRNGLRNADEVGLWLKYLNGELATPAPDAPFVILGDANLDPFDGEGVKTQMQNLLADPRLQDPKPSAEHGLIISNLAQTGDPALDTVDWTDPEPGNLRVDYVLPSADLTVLDAGVAWSLPFGVNLASRHGLVWVDIAQFP